MEKAIQGVIDSLLMTQHALQERINTDELARAEQKIPWVELAEMVTQVKEISEEIDSYRKTIASLRKHERQLVLVSEAA